MSAIRALTMPKWGIEMQEGTVTGWHKAVGETVAEGEELIDIETDKIVNTVESPHAGVLRRTLVGEGDVKSVGELIGVLAEAATSESDIDAFIASFRAADTSFEPDDDTRESPPEPAAATEAATPTPPAEVRISPIARRVAAKLGVDLSGVAGTGRNGRISKEDVEAAARAQGLLDDEPGEAPAFEVVRLTGTQKTAARRLQEAKQQIPHFYLEADVALDRLMEVASQAEVSLNAALLKAMGMALAAVPEANVQFVDETLHRYTNVDVGMAVATDRGLMVPVLRDVAGKSLAELAAAARDLAERARNRKLVAADLEGGTSTVSNLGMFGVDRFQAIVNPPQTTILAVGCALDRPVADDGAVAVRPVVSVALSCDHRAIDGALGARLLAAFRNAVASGLEGCA